MLKWCVAKGCDAYIGFISFFLLKIGMVALRAELG